LRARGSPYGPSDYKDMEMSLNKSLGRQKTKGRSAGGKGNLNMG